MQSTVLLTDALDLFEGNDLISDVRSLAAPPAKRAAGLGETHVAQLLAQTAEAANELAEPWTLVLHAQALAGPWDAPLELRDALSEEGRLAAGRVDRPAEQHARRRLRSR